MATALLAVAQMSSDLGDVPANRANAVRLVRDAAAAGAKLVVFPECALSGYAFDSLDECVDAAIAAEGPEIAELATLARELDITVVVGYLERDAERPRTVYNTATALTPDGGRGDYRKVHLPSMCADRFVTPGEQTPVVVPSPLGGIGLSICYDIRFPEWARSLALGGASIIASPVNFAIPAARVPALFPPARAHENAVYLLIANRGDSERSVEYLGGSAIYSPMGDALATTGRGQDLVFAEADLDLAGCGVVVFEPGVSEVHFLRDRRPELYGAVTRPQDSTPSDA